MLMRDRIDVLTKRGDIAALFSRPTPLRYLRHTDVALGLSDGLPTCLHRERMGSIEAVAIDRERARVKRLHWLWMTGSNAMHDAVPLVGTTLTVYL